MTEIPDNLQEVANRIHRDKVSHIETTRTLLAWFGAMRRGIHVASTIREALEKVRLKTDPDFEVAFIDGEIEFTALEFPSSTAEPSQDETPDDDPFLKTEIGDPVPRIGMLPSANKQPTSVTPDDPLNRATTIMLMNDYSQLPVMQGERSVKGIISWVSIGKANAKNKEAQYVRDCMEPDIGPIRFDLSLFEAIQRIIEHGYVLIKGKDESISGIVTSTDINLQFKELSESFLLVGEIENHIRRLVNGKFRLSEIKAMQNVNDDEREVRALSDLTFGEYMRLLENPVNWERLNLNLDRATLVKRLDAVRRIRNDVMHFHPDGISEKDHETLHDTVRFIQTLTSD